MVKLLQASEEYRIQCQNSESRDSLQYLTIHDPEPDPEYPEYPEADPAIDDIEVYEVSEGSEGSIEEIYPSSKPILNPSTSLHYRQYGFTIQEISGLGIFISF